MKIDQAKAGAVLATQIEAIQATMLLLAIAINENWPVTALKAVAPDVGASRPGGTTVDIIPNGKSSDKDSQIAMKAAMASYQEQLAALTAQLEAL